MQRMVRIPNRVGLTILLAAIFSNTISPIAGVVDTSWGPIKIGIYARYLERWFQFFSLTQFLFISGERLISDPA